MTRCLIVPVDGSPTSWAAFDVATGLAQRTGREVCVAAIEPSPDDVEFSRQRLEEGIAARKPADVTVSAETRVTADTVAAEIEALVAERDDATVVMTSHGRGRSAAIVGSVAEEVLRRTAGPIVVVGPNAEISDFTGPIVVTVDGSNESEAALPLAAAWANELRVEPWIVQTIEPMLRAPADGDVFDTAYVARLARGLQATTDSAVQWEELHDEHPSTAVANFARQLGASLILASSHGRTGLSRLAMGSVTSGFIRAASCPVLVMCLAELDDRAHDRASRPRASAEDPA